MKHKIKVVMLPTEDKTHIVLRNSDNKLIYYKNLVCNKEFVHLKGQHLYVTVSQDVEPIKEGETYVRDDGRLITRGNTLTAKGRKVIATTDPKLKLNCTCMGMKDKVKCNWMCKTHKDYMLPQLQQSFLKEFVANPDGKWVVDYYADWDDLQYNEFGEYAPYKLKLNQDNTVNITSVEEKMYSTGEVRELCKKAYRERYKTLDDWIKENL
jgi:hypothetical protein